MKKVLFAFITLCLSSSNLIADDDNFTNSKKSRLITQTNIITS